MGVIDLSAGFPIACEKKANEKLSALFSNIEALPRQDQIEKLGKTFDLFASCATAALDNFQPYKFAMRQNSLRPSPQIQGLMQTGIQGVMLFSGVMQKVESLGLSSEFLLRSKKADKIIQALQTGLVVYNREMAYRGEQGLPEMVLSRAA